MNNKKYNYDILLIDADDTLFDFRQAEKNALHATLNEFSLPFNDDIYLQYHEINKRMWKEYESGIYRNASDWKIRFQRLLKAINKQGDAALINKTYTNNLGKQPILLPDCEDVCAQLSKTHLLYIVTNGNATVQHSRFDASSIRNYFSGMFISGEIGSRKPQKVFFDFVFSKINPADLSRVLMIGDSLSSDIAGGINAGLDTCWFNPNGETAPPELTPTYEITELKNLLSIV